jgi:hypothetical protein
MTCHPSGDLYPGKPLSRDLRQGYGEPVSIRQLALFRVPVVVTDALFIQITEEIEGSHAHMGSTIAFSVCLLTFL